MALGWSWVGGWCEDFDCALGAAEDFCPYDFADFEGEVEDPKVGLKGAVWGVWWWARWLWFGD